MGHSSVGIFDRETVPFVIFEATAVPLLIFEAVPLVILLFCEAPGQSQPKLPSPAPRIASAKNMNLYSSLRTIRLHNRRHPKVAPVPDVRGIGWNDCGDRR